MTAIVKTHGLKGVTGGVGRFLQDLMEVVATQDVSVVLSSHLVADLERVCDYLIVLAASRVQVAGEVGESLASHHRLSGPRRDLPTLPANQEVIEESHTDKQTTLLVHTDEPILDPVWNIKPVTLDDLVLAYMSQARVISLIRPHLIAPAHLVSALDPTTMSYVSTNGGPAILEPGPPNIPNAWIYSTRILDKAGHALTPQSLTTTCPQLRVLRTATKAIFTAKDFRTWGGSVTVTEALVELGPPQSWRRPGG